MKNSGFASVGFPDMAGKEFTYKYDCKGAVTNGARVVVPFKNGTKTGYVTSADCEPPESVKKFKKILEVVSPVINKNLFKLALWIAEYYREDLARVVHMMYPPSARLKVKEIFTKTPAFVSGNNPVASYGLPQKFNLKEFTAITGQTGTVLNNCINDGYIQRKHYVSDGKQISRFAVLTGGVTCESLAKRAISQRSALTRLIAMGGESSAREFDSRVLRELEKKGLLSIETRENIIGETRALESAKLKELNEEQRKIADDIKQVIGCGFSSHLIHGVTGSGKTEVYLKLIEEVLKQGKDALYLVPEVALTTHLMKRIREAFGDNVVLTHGYMKPRERYDSWRRAAGGGGLVTVGPRSAVFTPLPALGLIIIDEEHEASYKQDETPRYNGRDTAIYRAKLENIPVILGSATPSVESYFNAEAGKYTLHQIHNRYNDATLPGVKVVNIAKDVFEGGRTYPFSAAMLYELNRRVELKEQSIIFLNRKGYDTHLLCKNCGKPAECDHCSKLLTYYKGESLLRCNLCGNAVPLDGYVCKECGSSDFEMRGLGTEKVSEKINTLIPDADIIRMDGSVARNYDTVKDVFNSFGSGKGDILIGTQLIAKGLDFENVTFVGIINADTMMNIPDFRANERTYQLISQVIGRSGRGAKPGLAMIQTFLRIIILSGMH